MTEIVPDRTASWELGQNSWSRPDKIQTNQYYKGVNVSTKGGNLSPRQAFVEQELEFENVTVKNERREEIPLKDLWRYGKFQAFIPYKTESNSYFITIISGLICRIEVRTGKVKLLSKDVTTSQYAARINWTFADNNIVIFNYPSRNIIINKTEVRYADAAKYEVPIAALGTFNQSRLIIAGALNEFTAGDVIGNSVTPDAPLTFNEVFTPGSPYVNQSFTVPTANPLYPITAMGLLQSVDSTTGVGPLFIATEREVYYYATNQPRDQWTQGEFGKPLLIQVGMAGPRSFVNANSDLIFLAPGGYVYSYSSAQDAAKKWSNVSISREVENYLKPRNPELVKYSVVSYYNNRVYISANPYRTKALDRNGRAVFDYAHGGMVVMELDQLATFLSQGSPVWAGLWTGIDVMDMSPIDEEFYAIGKSGEKNRLYKITDESTVDVVKGKKRKIRSIVYTKQYNHQNSDVDKKEVSLVTDIYTIAGEFEYKVERKPTHSSYWELYDTYQHTAPLKSENVPSDFFIHGYAPHRFKPIIFGEPKVSGCNPISNDLHNTFSAIQYRLTMEGDYWEISTFKTNAKPVSGVERKEDFTCRNDELVFIPKQDEPDWKTQWIQSITKNYQNGIFSLPNYLTKTEADVLSNIIRVQGIPGKDGKSGLPGQKGDPGEKGEAGASGVGGAIYTSGENISALRAVYFDRVSGRVLKADKDSLTECLLLIGISNTSGTPGSDIDIRTFGELNDSSWSWDISTPDPSIFLGVNGALTQTPPTTGVRVKIGKALTATKIFINTSESILLI